MFLNTDVKFEIFYFIIYSLRKITYKDIKLTLNRSILLYFCLTITI